MISWLLWVRLEAEKLLNFRNIFTKLGILLEDKWSVLHNQDVLLRFQLRHAWQKKRNVS